MEDHVPGKADEPDEGLGAGDVLHGLEDGRIPGGRSEDAGQIGEDRIAGVGHDPDVGGSEHHEGREREQEGRRQLPAAGQEIGKDGRREEEPQVLDPGRRTGERGSGDQPGPVARNPEAPGGEERAGDEERQERLDIGRAGEMGDDRVAQIEPRRDPAGPGREGPPPPGHQEAGRGEDRPQGDEMGGDVICQQQGLREEQLRERREDRKLERRHGRESPRLCKGAGEGQVVEGLVEGGRRVERENEERREREQADADPAGGAPSGHAAEIHEGRAPGPERGAMDRHDQRDQDTGPQQAERAEQKAEVGQEGEPERGRHGEPLRPVFPGKCWCDQRAGRPRAGGQNGQGQQMRGEERGRSQNAQ